MKSTSSNGKRRKLGEPKKAQRKVAGKDTNFQENLAKEGNWSQEKDIHEHWKQFLWTTEEIMRSVWIKFGSLSAEFQTERNSRTHSNSAFTYPFRRSLDNDKLSKIFGKIRDNTMLGKHLAIGWILLPSFSGGGKWWQRFK